MQARRLMRKKPVTVKLDTPLSVIWDLTATKQIHMIPVLDYQDKLRGIITAEDLLKNLVPNYRHFFTQFYPDAPTIEDIENQIDRQVLLTAQDVMNKTVHYAYEDMDVFKALSRMLAYNVRILPIIDDDDKLRGFIVEKDIFHYLFTKKNNLFKKLKKIKPDTAPKIPKAKKKKKSPFKKLTRKSIKKSGK